MSEEEYPHRIGDLPKGTRIAIPEEFYEIEGVIQHTEHFGREGLLLGCGEISYPSSALQCRVIAKQSR